MPRLDDIRRHSGWADILEGQGQHLMILGLMLAGANALLVPGGDRVLGLTGRGWALVSIWGAVAHQVVVAAGFRLQLHRALLTRIFGAGDMRAWAVIFLPLLVLRPLTLVMTGWADAVPITGLRWAEVTLGLALLVPAAWGLHSTLVHFTLTRALGGDHFRDEIAALPMVDKGIFAWTRNGMYGVVFLGLWGIALLFGSWNALVVALFQHGYIWVHMYCTEAPDLARIHGTAQGDVAGGGNSA